MHVVCTRTYIVRESGKEKESLPVSGDSMQKLLQECKNIEQTEFTPDTLVSALVPKESQRVYAL